MCNQATFALSLKAAGYLDYAIHLAWCLIALMGIWYNLFRWSYSYCSKEGYISSWCLKYKLVFLSPDNIAALQILYEKYLDFLLLCLIGGLKCRNEQIRVIFPMHCFDDLLLIFYLCNFSFGITLWVFAIKKTLCRWFSAWPAAIILCLDSIILCVVWLLQTNRISTGYQYIFKWPM